jgi:hypothetical protein
MTDDRDDENSRQHGVDAIAAFAAAHGLELTEHGEVRELTPALISGSRGSVGSLAAGDLAPGLEGRLFEHVFATASARRESAIVLTEVPESAAFVPALVCRDRASMGGHDLEQLPAERWTTTELESAAFNSRYRLLTLAGQDAGWVRELFSPELVVWLAGEAPAGLSFELNEGHLVVALPGPLESLERVEVLCGAAAEVAARIRAEAAEEELDPDLFDEAAELAAIEKAIAKVDFKRPPASVGDAVQAYRRVAARTPSVLLNAIFWALVAAAVCVVAIAVLFDPPAVVLLGGLIAALPGFSAARYHYSSRYRWGTASVSRVGLEAWVREYARSRKLELRDRWRFHAEHRQLPMPGFADQVLAGQIPEAEIDGLFVMFGDAAEMRSKGTEVAYASDRPLASNALVVHLERPLSPERVAAAKLPENYSAAVAGSDLIVWLPIAGNLLRTGAGSDGFRKKAGEVVRRLSSTG